MPGVTLIYEPDPERADAYRKNIEKAEGAALIATTIEEAFRTLAIAPAVDVISIHGMQHTRRAGMAYLRELERRAAGTG